MIYRIISIFSSRSGLNIRIITFNQIIRKSMKIIFKFNNIKGSLFLISFLDNTDYIIDNLNNCKISALFKIKLKILDIIFRNKIDKQNGAYYIIISRE